jgi:4-amino-4-deoxy-L-arabinose transferase-like glycosyltransferase
MLFLFCFGAGLVVSFLGTAGLVACLWVIARARPVTKTLTILTGTALGILGCLCFTYINWHASGPDSGPPTETMLSYFLRNWNDPFLAAFVFGGFFTALIYDLIARRFSRVEPRTA